MDPEEETYLFISGEVDSVNADGEPVDESPLAEERPYDLIVRKAGIPATAFNLINGAIGVGIVSLPYAVSLNGLLQGLIIAMLLPTFSGITLVMLSQVISDSGEITYEEAIKRAFYKSRFFKFIQPVVIFIMILIPFGSQVAYLVLVNDQILRISQMLSDTYWKEIQLSAFFVITFFIVLPVSCLKSTKSLSYTSFVAVLSAVYVSCLLTVQYVWKLVFDWDPSIFDGISFVSTLDFLGFLESLPLLIFSACSHQVCFSIFPELKNPKVLRRVIPVGIETSTLFVLYFLAAAFGYLAYGSNADPDVLKNLSIDSIFTLVARFALMFVGSFSYPLQLFILRRTLNKILFAGYPDSYPRDLFSTFVLTVASFVIAILVPWIDVCMGFVGAIGMNSILYIFPPILFVRFRGKSLNIFVVLFCYLLSFCGLISLIITTIVCTFSLIKKYT